MTDRDDKKGLAQGFGEGYSYVAAGFTFAFAILLFGAAGWLLDGWIHTRPLFAVLAGLLGGVAAFMNLYYRVQRDIEQDRERKRKDKGAGSREP
ncbi:MAG TPA: AtpZ/AtpI family protein [Gemmatimonadales bacterium]|jgi:F0F1-type ATP synthase assembly protein I|nr:AtpZ/AtpI family protein [Gemmatimonadales bacterium]